MLRSSQQFIALTCTLEGVPVEVIVSGPFRALPETSIQEKTDKR